MRIPRMAQRSCGPGYGSPSAHLTFDSPAENWVRFVKITGQKRETAKAIVAIFDGLIF
jgi:hypothetical protein